MNNEIGELSNDVIEMTAEIDDHLDRISRITAERERIGAELGLATDIQRSMLPHVFPPFPNRSEMDLYALMESAREVGGDFYDFFMVDDDHLCLVIADVSGKGIPAALFMMISKIIIKSCAMLGEGPAWILRKTNEAICEDNQTEMFVTVWVGILELSTGILKAASAGHEYPVIRHPGSRFELYKDQHGFVIGGLEDMEYTEYEVQMQPGSEIFVYTDGVPEASDAENNMFGIQRMLASLNETTDASPEMIIRHVRHSIDMFTRDGTQFDDLTMLCIRYNGKD
jgi:sigma-B regulation protein RsbU (phosphoserine phosphatase)